MGWALIAIAGAGAAQAAWAMVKAYQRMAAARDELDDSLHVRTAEQAAAGVEGK
jgi:hypothetical protein